MAGQRRPRFTVQIVAVYPLDVWTCCTILLPVLFSEWVQPMRDIAQRALSRTRYFAYGIGNFAEHSEVRIVDSQNLISHRKLTRSLVCQIVDRDHRGSIPAP